MNRRTDLEASGGASVVQVYRRNCSTTRTMVIQRIVYQGRNQAVAQKPFGHFQDCEIKGQRAVCSCCSKIHVFGAGSDSSNRNAL